VAIYGLPGGDRHATLAMTFYGPRKGFLSDAKYPPSSTVRRNS